MIRTLLTAAALALTVASAHADTMPRFLEGQWCQHENGLYIRAKNFCKPTRPMVYSISRFMFVVSGSTTPRVKCSPVSVNPSGRGWTVVADCGDGNPFEIQFEDGQMYGGPRGSLSITENF